MLLIFKKRSGGVSYFSFGDPPSMPSIIDVIDAHMRDDSHLVVESCEMLPEHKEYILQHIDAHSRLSLPSSGSGLAPTSQTDTLIAHTKAFVEQIDYICNCIRRDIENADVFKGLSEDDLYKAIYRRLMDTIHQPLILGVRLGYPAFIGEGPAPSLADQTSLPAEAAVVEQPTQEANDVPNPNPVQN
jgi:hypothetical protein